MTVIVKCALYDSSIHHHYPNTMPTVLLQPKRSSGGVEGERGEEFLHSSAPKIRRIFTLNHLLLSWLWKARN